MGSYMLNSVFVTVVAIFLLVIIALPASYVLARFKCKSSKFWNVLFMAGLFINVNYIVVPIFLMLNDGDKWIYKTFGTTFFMNNLFVLAFVYAATALPFTIYLLSGYFKTLARDYEEAAYVDGAGYFRTMVQIIIPMAKPSIVTVILFNFLAFWNEYIISMTLLTKPELKTLPVGLMNLMAAQRSAVQYGKMYAGLVIVMLPTLILYMCVQKKLTQGNDSRRTERLRRSMRSENGKKLLLGILIAVVFVVCIALVIVGQRKIGPSGLLMMLVGLAGLLVLLWIYNRQYK